MTTKSAVNIFDRAIELITTQKTEIAALKAENGDLKTQIENAKSTQVESDSSLAQLDELLTAEAIALEPLPEPVAEPIAEVAPMPVPEPVKAPDWATPLDPALVPVQTDVLISM